MPVRAAIGNGRGAGEQDPFGVGVHGVQDDGVRLGRRSVRQRARHHQLKPLVDAVQADRRRDRPDVAEHLLDVDRVHRRLLGLAAEHEHDVLLRCPRPHPLGRIGAVQRGLEFRGMADGGAQQFVVRRSARFQVGGEVLRPVAHDPSPEVLHRGQVPDEVGQCPAGTARHVRPPPAGEHRLGGGVGEPPVHPLEHREVLCRARSCSWPLRPGARPHPELPSTRARLARPAPADPARDRLPAQALRHRPR